MRLITYILIALLFGVLGYKIAELTMVSKQIKSNMQPIVDELKIQLKAVQDRLSVQTGLTANEIQDLELKKETLIDLLAKFYGYSKDQINDILKTV